MCFDVFITKIEREDGKKKALWPMTTGLELSVALQSSDGIRTRILALRIIILRMSL